MVTSERLPRALVRQFAQFAIVGGLGMITNLACFFTMVDLGGTNPFAGSFASFSVAVSQNYALNELWTFNASGGNRLGAARYAKFVTSSLLGLGVNLALLGLLLRTGEFPLLIVPQFIGILGGTLVNYTLSRQVAFR